MAGKTEIGKLAVVLTAESNQFDQTMTRSQNRIKQFEKDNSKGGGALGKLFGGVSFGGGEGGGGFLGGNIGELVEGLGTKTGAAAAAFLALAVAAKKSFEAIKEAAVAAGDLHDEAEALGATAAGLVALRTAAGKESEALDTGLAKLSRDIGSAIDGSEEAEKAFNKLGLSSKELAAVPLDDAFVKVAAAINQLPTAYQKASAAREIFGKTGQKLGNLIGKGEGFLNTQIDNAIRRGAAPGKEFADSGEEYERAKAELEQVWKGVKNSFMDTVGVQVMNVGTDWLKQITHIADEIRGAAKTDKQIAAERESARLAMAKQQAEQQADKARKDREAAMTKANEDADKLLKSYQEQLDVLKLGSAEMAKIAQLGEQNVSIAKRQALVVKDIETRELKRSKSLFDETRTPLEKFQQEMAELQSLFDRGKIDADLFARAQLRGVEALGQFDKQYEGLNPLERGSQADRSFGLKLDFDQKQAAKTAQEKIADALNDAKQRDQKRNQLLDDIKRGLAEQPALGVQPI